VLFRYLLIVFVFFFQRTLSSQDQKSYFYHHYSYGSESVYNPLTFIINQGYGIFQIGNSDKKPFAVQYRTGWVNVWKNVGDPIRQIRTFGWKRFLSTEVIPTSLKPESAQYVPNYQEHLIGGGMSHRALTEWFRVHGFSHEKLWSCASYFSMHLLNEVVENNDYRGTTVDPIADLLIFDPLGILLFSSDRVARFFGETLHMRDWSGMPAYNPRTQTLENNSNSYSIKWFIPGQSTWAVFYHFGLSGLLGISYARADGSCWSAGGGVMSHVLKQVKEVDTGRVMTADLIWNAGIYYDRNGSLMASLLFSGSRAYKAKANVFPGLFHLAGFSPAIFAALGQKNEFIFGFGINPLPLGIAFQN
jgi:hypothetical protein